MTPKSIVRSYSMLKLLLPILSFSIYIFNLFFKLSSTFWRCIDIDDLDFIALSSI